MAMMMIKRIGQNTSRNAAQTRMSNSLFIAYPSSLARHPLPVVSCPSFLAIPRAPRIDDPDRIDRG
jgi:hypothetical protein